MSCCMLVVTCEKLVQYQVHPLQSRLETHVRRYQAHDGVDSDVVCTFIFFGKPLVEFRNHTCTIECEVDTPRNDCTLAGRMEP